MTEPFITQCPNCGTAFEVSERELSMADGIVRCGQCRHVFTATDFPVSADALSSSSADDDDTPDFARHDDEEVEDIGANVREAVTQKQPDEEELLDDAVFDDEVGVEEAAAKAVEARQMKFSDAFLTTDEEAGNAFADEREDEGKSRPEVAAPAPEATNNDDSGEFDDVRPFILDDFDEEPEEALDTITQKEMPVIHAEDDAETPTRDDLPVVDIDNLDDAFSALDEERPKAAYDDDVVMAEPMHSKLERIGGAPVEMPVYDTRGILQREGLWLAVACLALIGLAVQYTTYHFDSLARDAQYRDTLATVCKVVGCTLPDEASLQNLQASNLIVRSHTQLRNALAVDFVLSNDAAFDQPFPKLLLQFSDVDGNALAQRTLEPKHYLSGEMAGARKIRAHQSVHVALEIADPGPAAISYALQPVAQ